MWPRYAIVLYFYIDLDGTDPKNKNTRHVYIVVRTQVLYICIDVCVYV